MHFSHCLIEHRVCNAKIAPQTARDLGIDAVILAPDRLKLHPSSETWDWKDYHRHRIESRSSPEEF